MPGPTATVERKGRSAVVRLHGDLTIPTASAFYSKLRALAKRRDVHEVVLDFSEAGRIDSSAIAVVALAERRLKRHGKTLELTALDDRQRAAFELLTKTPTEEPAPLEVPGALERMGDSVLGAATGARALLALVADTGRQTLAVVTRRKRLPAGSVGRQIAMMGVDGIFIVALLSFLLGMTMAFQGAVQLQKFGAGVFVADMIGMSMVRELAPLITAIILTGRTGAAIAAELGTMKVRSEIDALATMGINPVRFLIVPRMLAITFVGPALTLLGIFVGMFGGMLVAALALDMSMSSFWARLGERVGLADYVHGMSKSLVFAWIIGFAGCHLGMRARGDAGSVGLATTRTVVVSIFFIILVDAVFATVSTIARHA